MYPRWYVNLAGTEFPLMTNAEMVDRVTGASHELVTKAAKILLKL